LHRQIAFSGSRLVKHNKVKHVGKISNNTVWLTQNQSTICVLHGKDLKASKDLAKEEKFCCTFNKVTRREYKPTS
jgi:hypothetical protein